MRTRVNQIATNIIESNWRFQRYSKYESLRNPRLETRTILYQTAKTRPWTQHRSSWKTAPNHARMRNSAERSILVYYPNIWVAIPWNQTRIEKRWVRVNETQNHSKRKRASALKPHLFKRLKTRKAVNLAAKVSTRAPRLNRLHPPVRTH